jgi:hypothetical protein
MRARATVLVLALLAALSVFAAAHSRDARAQAAALGSTGDVEVANSANGSAILAGVLGPGDSLAGTVTISNIGTQAGDFTLALSHLTDTPGPGGGFFSRQLDLAVDDVTAPTGPVAVYRGKLNSLTPRALGSFAAGGSHVYRFVVSWAAGDADQTMAGSSMSVEFDWSTGRGTTTTDPAPTPTPTPTPVSGATPPVVSAPATAPKLTLGNSSRQPVLRDGGARVTASCAVDCTVVGGGSLSVPGAAKTYKLVPARRSAPSGRKVTLKLRLPRGARGPLRGALRNHHRPVVSVSITATGANGMATVVTRKIRVSG